MGAAPGRGALAAVSAAATDGRPVVTASAGNHGLGTAFAATRLGARACVVVPENASSAKVEALRGYDIDLRLIGDSYDAAEAAAVAIAADTGARFVSAYSDPDVIAGQATIVGEITDLLSEPLRIVVPVGGGGLASGVALAAPDRVPVVGVESAQSRAVSASMAAGQVVEVHVGPTIADGLAGNISADAMTPAILRSAGVPVLAAAEDDIRAAVCELALRHGVVAEGSGAAGVAAARAGDIPADLPTVFVVTGRNIAAETLTELLTK
ncbi:threonine ammonia-lyase [Mycolicibacterium brumae]|uniref:threonine ammonia-lyase n=1 Tax=Mycolicibacterium brumae TaxID=85968 RepID=UPI0021AFDD91|nr:pyridoxal-phosphate dependent enzyme [Mycolicibacterium brumae]